jgi:hypothetical protein
MHLLAMSHMGTDYNMFPLLVTMCTSHLPACDFTVTHQHNLVVLCRSWRVSQDGDDTKYISSEMFLGQTPACQFSGFYIEFDFLTLD